MMAYGYRLWMEGRSSPQLRVRLNSESEVDHLLAAIIAKADMSLAAGPFVYKEPSREIGKGPGVTGVAILIESSIHVHTYPEQDYYFFELFSCRVFNPKAIIRAVCSFMGKDECQSEFVPVGHEFPVEDVIADGA